MDNTLTYIIIGLLVVIIILLIAAGIVSWIVTKK